MGAIRSRRRSGAVAGGWRGQAGQQLFERGDPLAEHIAVHRATRRLELSCNVCKGHGDGRGLLPALQLLS